MSLGMVNIIDRVSDGTLELQMIPSVAFRIWRACIISSKKGMEAGQYVLSHSHLDDGTSPAITRRSGLTAVWSSLQKRPVLHTVHR
jgi:hypothetical protein